MPSRITSPLFFHHTDRYVADPFAPWDAPDPTKKMPPGIILADPTRLELATSAVTGQRSNQLSYESTTLYSIAYFSGKINI